MLKILGGFLILITLAFIVVWNAANAFCDLMDIAGGHGILSGKFFSKKSLKIKRHKTLSWTFLIKYFLFFSISMVILKIITIN